MPDALPLTPGKRGFKTWALLVFLACIAATTTALGLWQLQRLGWKQALIARVETRVHAPPIPPPNSLWAAPSRDQHEYLRVRLSGMLLHQFETPVYASTVRGPGYWIMTPLVAAQGTVWINRGFVDAAHRNPATRPHDDREQPVTITGLVRMPEHAGLFLRANVPSEQRWYVRSPNELSAAYGLSPPFAAWFLDQEATATENTWPIPGMTVIQFRNAHLSYALTWFALAAMSSGALAWLWRMTRVRVKKA